MKKLIALLLFMVGLGSVAYAQGPGYHAEVQVFATAKPDPKTLLWSATFRHNRVEFDITPRSRAKTFCIQEPFLNMNQARGFVVLATNGDDKDGRRFFMPKSTTREEAQWCFNAERSYRFSVWLVQASGTVATEYPVDFEIEQVHPYLTDLRQGSAAFAMRAKSCLDVRCQNAIGP